MRIEVEPLECIIVPEHPAQRAKDGCWIRIIFAIYPEPIDSNFAKYEQMHHVYVPIDWNDYKSWVATLPKDKDGLTIYPNKNDIYDYPGTRHWVYNPIAHHGIWVEPTITDQEIRNFMSELREIYLSKMEKDESMIIEKKQVLKRTNATPARIAACEARIQTIKNNPPTEITAARTRR